GGASVGGGGTSGWATRAYQPMSRPAICRPWPARVRTAAAWPATTTTSRVRPSFPYAAVLRACLCAARPRTTCCDWTRECRHEGGDAGLRRGGLAGGPVACRTGPVPDCPDPWPA